MTSSGEHFCGAQLFLRFFLKALIPVVLDRYLVKRFGDEVRRGSDGTTHGVAISSRQETSGSIV
jgi:hypothetical protein